MKRLLGEPNFIYGIIIGLAFAVLGGFLLVSEVFTFGLLGLFIVVAIFLSGLLLGYFATRLARHSLGKKSAQLWPQIADLWLNVSWDLNRSNREQLSRDEVSEIFKGHTESVKGLTGDISRWIGSAYMRMLAFGSLFTMLGLLISFAVFWATFLQVSRLEEQIETTKTAKQVDIALSLASNYQFLVNSFIADISTANTGNRLSDRQYRRLEATLRQLKPYIGVNPHTSELDSVANSPEQSFLLQYLLANQIQLPASKIRLNQLKAHHLDVQFAELSRTDFSESDLSGANFYKSVLTGAKFKDATIRNGRFLLSSLNRAVFSNANLSNSDFTATDITGARFDNAVLTDVNFADVEGWKKIATIKGADISGIKNAPEGFREWALANGAVIP